MIRLGQLLMEWPCGHGFQGGSVGARRPSGVKQTPAEDLLLQICCLRRDDPQVAPECLATMRRVVRMLAEAPPDQHPQLEPALTLLASALGQLPRFNPTHSPFGYSGPKVHFRGYIDRETLERIGSQVVGLLRHHTAPDSVARAVQQTVSQSIRLGLLDQRRYDAWRPGMRSGTGWRCAVSATPCGVARAGFVDSADYGLHVTALEPPRRSKPRKQDERDAAKDAADVGDTDASIPGGTVAPTNRKPVPRRGTRVINIETLEKELEKHLVAARDHAHSLQDGGREPVLMPRPSQRELARRTGLTECDVSRCLNDKRAPILRILWEAANSLDAVIMYQRRTCRSQGH